MSKKEKTYWNPLEKNPQGSPGYYYYYTGMIYLAFDRYGEFKEFIKEGVDEPIGSWKKEVAMRKFDELFKNENRVPFLKENIEDFVRSIAGLNLEEFVERPTKFNDPEQPNARVLFMLYLFLHEKQAVPDHITNKKEFIKEIQDGFNELEDLDEFIAMLQHSIDYWAENRESLLG